MRRLRLGRVMVMLWGTEAWGRPWVCWWPEGGELRGDGRGVSGRRAGCLAMPLNNPFMPINPLFNSLYFGVDTKHVVLKYSV